MSSSRKVSIVIPNWNGESLLKKNLKSVIKAKNNPNNNIAEIIIVDDFSTDSSVNFLKKNYNGKIRLFQHKENRGFAQAVNLGVRMAKYSLVCLLNTDVIPSENFLEHSLPHFNDKKVFGVSFNEKEFGPAIGRFTGGFVEHHSGKQTKTVSSSFWVSGGSGIFSRKIWMKLKGLDSNLFHPFYWEDVDISYRALKRGLKVLWEPNSKVSHKHESTVGRSPYSKKERELIIERNQLLFIWKNITSKGLFEKHKKALLRRAIKHPGYIKVIFMALKKYKVVKKNRELEIKQSIVSDEAVFATFN